MSQDAKITIREAVASNAAALAEVQAAAWKTAYRGMLPDEALDSLTVTERTVRWKKILAENPRATLVASVGDRVIGWSGFGASRDDDRAGRSDRSAEVYGLYVHPDTWRSGTGRALWQTTCQRLKNEKYRSLDVWVLEANERVRRFYEAVGCVLDADTTKMFEGNGYSVPEVGYSLTL